MSKTKRSISVLLVLATLLSMFAVCGSFTTSAATATATNSDSPSCTTYVQTGTSSYTSITFEKSIVGALGWTVCAGKTLHKSAAKSSGAVTSGYTVSKGQQFIILNSSPEKSTGIVWWKIAYGSYVGWIDSSYCMINLCDIIPSIYYNMTNSYSSKFMTGRYYTGGTSSKKGTLTGSQTSIKNVTGKALTNYNSTVKYNGRTDTDDKEYVCPVLFHTAYMIQKAQNKALNQGYSLKIFDSYRPYSAALQVSSNYENIWSNNYGKSSNGVSFLGTKNKSSWFISSSNTSDHTVGGAIDVTLVKKNGTSLDMPTAMHMLTAAAAKNASTTPSYSTSVASYQHSMTTAAKKLNEICLSVGMSGLSSEWWHFGDHTSMGYSRALSAAQTTSSKGCDFTPKYMSNTLLMTKGNSSSDKLVSKISGSAVTNYKSFNKNVVTVDKNGKVTAVAKGKTAILLTAADGSTKIYSISVQPKS